ncbi:hypothetical protein [Thiocapsa marina]|uniref:Uncharacterized protein n=1 Tax=Thiocapsa marina 5811 TaxID=768671 RepID=F9UHH9_9GAMM|nr:hypothetical protein [Thiocapsa marina]EGV16288.1 hypothetical protein ThimaDRAFT_4382 [Thiocapsa marina 5811]
MDTDSAQISDTTHHGGRSTRSKVVRAAGPEAAKDEAECPAGRYQVGRVVGIGKR